MPLDLSGFVTPTQNYDWLGKAADTLGRQRQELEKTQKEQEGKQAATSKFLTDYLDPKDHLTGTNYDPQVVSGYGNILQQAQTLAQKGASTSDILMAIGPSVNKLNQYSVTAKQVSQQIKDSVGRLKGYAGYNPEALEAEAKKQAFYGPDGKLKDPSTVDPNQDYVAMAAKNSPELVTTGKGLDDFVNKTPMADYSRSVTTAYAGRSKVTKIEAKHPFWEDLTRDAKGNILTDPTGAPQGLGVVGSPMLDDKNQPIVNPQTGQPFQVMDKDHFNAIMTHNPDVADYVRGQVNQHFKAAGAKELPAEGSPQWDMMARHILGDELDTRKRSTFRTVDQQKETAPAVKVEIGRDPNMLNDLAKYESAVKLKGDYSIYDPKAKKAVKTNAVEAIGKVFNNDPVYLGGEHTEVGGRNVIDVTDFLPGGGLKSGRGDDEVYKGIYYDPAKRSLLVTQQARTKDKTGQKPTDLEEIPESKAGLFMTRIAAANGVDPDKVSGILGTLGYKGAKFTSPSQPGTIPTDLAKEHNDKINSALNEDKYDSPIFKGLKTPDGTIQKVDQRTYTAWLPGRDKFAVDVKTADGKTKTITFKTKDELTQYIKKGQPEAPKAVLD